MKGVNKDCQVEGENNGREKKEIKMRRKNKEIQQIQAKFNLKERQLQKWDKKVKKLCVREITFSFDGRGDFMGRYFIAGRGGESFLTSV